MAGSRALPDLIARLKLDTSDLKKAETAVKSMDRQMESSAKAASSSLRSIQGHAANTHTSITKMGAGFLQATASVAAGLGVYNAAGAAFSLVSGGLRDTISAGIAYQDEMNTLRAVSGATADQMKALNQRAIDLGNDLTLPSTSAADAATAMTELVKAGLNVNEAMDAAKGVLQLAAAATVDEGTAATYTADALNAFHLKGKDAVMVADLLAGAANASSGEISDMALAMQQSAAVFSAAHVPIQTTVALIAEMANQGIRGSDAGTSLKTMMLALQSPTAQAAAQMKALHINLYDAHGQMRRFEDIIQDAQGPLSKLTQAQRDSALATIFGSDAVRAANIVFGSGADALKKMTAEVSKAGSAADVAAAKSQGLGGAWRGLQSQIETLELELFQKASPALEGFIRGLSERLPAAAESARVALERTAEGASKVADAVRPAFEAGGKDVQAWGAEMQANVQKALQSKEVQAAFDAFKGDMQDLGNSMHDLVRSEAFASFVAAMTVLVPAAIGPALTGLQLMVDQFRFVTTALFGLAKVTWDIAKGDWKQAWKDASDTVKTETENQQRYVQDSKAFIQATTHAMGDDVNAEYERMKNQTFIQMNGINQNNQLAMTEARIAMNQQARQTGDEFTANMAGGLRAGGTRVSDAADQVVGDAVARAHAEASNAGSVGAFLAQGIAYGLASNSGFISSAAVAATRNAMREAQANANIPLGAAIPNAKGGVIRAAGGYILPGYAPGRDIVPALLSPGEAVLRPEAVRMLGPAIIDRLNAVAPAAIASGGRQGGVTYNVSVSGSVAPMDERRLVAALREMEFLYA